MELLYMQSRHLLFVLLFFTLCSCKRNGYREEFDENGNLKYSGNFIDGVPHGQLKEYNIGGSIKRIFNSNMGKLDGAYTILGIGDSIVEVGNYHNDTLNGVVKKFLGRLYI